MLKEFIDYHELLFSLVLRDLKVRYKQTVMGIAWAVLQPLTMMLIFTLIFGRLAKIPSDGIPYPVFVFSGMIAWSFFSSAVSSAGMSLVGASNLVSKVYFPRIIIPVSSIGVAMVDFLIGAILLLVIMMFYQVGISTSIIFLPMFLLGLALVSLGIGTWLAAVTVSYRDFRFVIPFMLQIWMYVSPVIYPASFIPEEWRWLLFLNPVYGWIIGVRASFLGLPIDWLAILISTTLTLTISFIGVWYFQKTQRRFADVI